MPAIPNSKVAEATEIGLRLLTKIESQKLVNRSLNYESHYSGI